ncbi:MAG: bifunctional DNA primase/polymerase [Phaeospirillum sp.]|nr:bifunctional DNA primase/polymerase [Phaeospirillum sp.]
MSPPDGHARPGGDGEYENGEDEVEISGNTDNSQAASHSDSGTRNIFRTHAQRHWDAGLPVIPLIAFDAPISGWVKSPGKQPAIRGWHAYGERMPDAQEQASWLASMGDCNMGLPLGPTSGLVAFDVDTVDGKILEILEGFMTIKSPWRRVGAKGYVVVYRYSGEKTFRIKDMEGNTICELLSKGTQVVLPPSIHPKTRAPYIVEGGVDLVDVFKDVPSLPVDFEKSLRVVLGGQGVRLSAGGSAGLTEMVPRSSRDDECTRKAGLFAYAVLRGERTLREALGMIEEWCASFTEQVSGDNLDPKEGIRKLIRLFVRDVRERGRLLPKGWDAGLSERDKFDLGLDFDGDEQERSYSEIIEIFNIDMEDALGGEQRLAGVNACLKRVHRSPSLSPILVESILQHVRKKSRLDIPLRKLQKELKDLKDNASFDHQDRPLIELIPSELPASVDAMEQALIAGDPGIFQRGDRVVRLGEQEVPTFKGEKLKTTRLYPVDANNLCERAMRVAKFEKFDARKNDKVQTKCPNDVASTYLSRVGDWLLPTLTGFVTTPTLRADGSILNTPGYDPTTGILYQPNAEFPELLDMPTHEDALAALTLLTDLVGTFKFVSSTDRAVWLSLVLTSVVRRSLDTAPLHAFSAPVAGSGKSKLVDLAAIIATGGRAGVITQADGDTELEKRLVTELLDGSPFIAIDNCTRPLGGDQLCAALTQTEVKLRVLGESRAPQVLTNATMAATGNSFRIKGDMGRRTLVCRLDPGVERPELLAFDFDPIEAVEGERGKYVIAALTILRAYAVSGSSLKVQPLNSFANWSRRVRDALVWLDEPDAVGTQVQLREDDPERKSAIEVLSQWNEVLGEEPVTVNRVITVVTDQHLAITPGTRNFVKPEFREALLSVAGRGGSVHGRALGEWLSGIKGRIIESMKIEHAGVRGGVALWRLVNLGG